MTNTQLPATTTTTTTTTTGAGAAAAPMVALISRDSGESLIDQIVRAVAARIDDRILRGGARMPSIRQFAAAHGVSAFTVVASYDKLVGGGYLESRRGAGFFVRERTALAAPGAAGVAGFNADTGAPQPLDVIWLVRNMFRQTPLARRPASAPCRPTGWTPP